VEPTAAARVHDVVDLRTLFVGLREHGDADRGMVADVLCEARVALRPALHVGARGELAFLVEAISTVSRSWFLLSIITVSD
jgi:hypothetical protein